MERLQRDSSSMCEEIQKLSEGEYVRKLGLMTSPGVVQIDIAAVTKHNSPTTGSDRALCDHHCGPEGGYTCPARLFSPENRGLKRNDLAPAEQLKQAIVVAAAGIEEFNKRFIDNSLVAYCRKFGIPDFIKTGMKQNLLEKNVMVNIFGGNPEIHPDVLSIAEACQDKGFRTTLTTTGGILLRDHPELFLGGLLAGSVDVLAVTGECKNRDYIERLAGMTKEQLRDEWTQTPVRLGQLKKGIETMNVLRLLIEHEEKFPQVLINLVVHREILGEIEDIIDALQQVIPPELILSGKFKINPYPAQSFRKHPSEPLSFSSSDVPALERFIAHRLEDQQSHHPWMVQRPHYWAMLASVLQTYRGNNEKIAEMFSGEGTWTCFGKPDSSDDEEDSDDIWGAGHIVQVGASPHVRDLIASPHAGGWKACFWDDRTITNTDEQVWNQQPEDIVKHIAGGMFAIAQTVQNPCKGCLMPRLNGDEIETELGMNHILKPAYLLARKSVVGF